MQRSNYQYNVLWIFELLIILILSIAIGKYFTERLEESQNSVNLSYTNTVYINRCFISLLNTETGARGYVISGMKEYLSPYNEGLNDFYTNFEKLLVLTRDNPIQQENLKEMKELAEQKISFLHHIIGVYDKSGIEAVKKETEQYREGKHIMDQVRIIVERMYNEEMRNLQDSYKSNSLKVKSMTYFIPVLNVINYLILVVVYHLIRQQEILRRTGAQQYLLRAQLDKVDDQWYDTYLEWQQNELKQGADRYRLDTEGENAAVDSDTTSKTEKS